MVVILSEWWPMVADVIMKLDSLVSMGVTKPGKSRSQVAALHHHRKKDGPIYPKNS